MNPRARFIQLAESIRVELTVYCRQMLWHKEDLEDVLQQVLATAFQKFTGFREGTEFRAWIFKIATYTLLNHNRRWHRDAHPNLEEREVDWEVELDREYQYEELLNDPEPLFSHLGDDLRRALLELSEKERAVLLLVSVAGLTCQETSASLEIPMGSVMGYLARARAKVRERLTGTVRSRT